MVAEAAWNRVDGRCELRLAGELTIYAAAELQPQLVAALDAGGDMDLDLDAVTEMDSAGFQQLEFLRRECRLLGRHLRVTACSDAARDVLQMFGTAPAYAPDPAAVR